MDAYRSKLDSFDSDIAHAIAGEERRQLDGVEMIPSEITPIPRLAALGSVLTNKYYRARPRLKARRTKGRVHFETKIDLMALHGPASRTGAAGCAPEPRSKP
jgi:glycine hydroxymethyltransferase